MSRSDMDEIRNALYHIREENNCIRIHINRSYFKRRTQELLEDGDERQARFYNSIVHSIECSSDIEISDDET